MSSWEYAWNNAICRNGQFWTLYIFLFFSDSMLSIIQFVSQISHGHVHGIAHTTLVINQVLTMFAFKSGWLISTPLSTIPMVTPLPVYPDSHASTIFIDGWVALCCIIINLRESFIYWSFWKKRIPIFKRPSKNIYCWSFGKQNFLTR